MSLGRVQQSAGALNRAESEFNLLKNENQKRLRTESSLARAKSDQKNALSNEADQSINKKVGAYYQDQSAIAASSAAFLSVWSAAFGAASSIVSAGSSGGIAAGIVAGVSGLFSVLGAYLAYRGAADEAEMLDKQYGYISKDAAEDQKNLKALDGNPAI